MKIPLNLLLPLVIVSNHELIFFMRVRVIKNALRSKIVKFFFAVNHVIQQDLRLNPILAPQKLSDSQCLKIILQMSHLNFHFSRRNDIYNRFKHYFNFGAKNDKKFDNYVKWDFLSDFQTL